MTSVFIGGSRKLSRLNDQIRRRLDNMVAKNLTVLVGDANGTDKAIQRYFSERRYRNVIVYCVEGVCRNNLGDWERRSIPSDANKRGWEHFAVKDHAMARDASCGFMIWDGKSQGTLNNVLNLVQAGKTSVLYFSPERRFFTIRIPQDVLTVLGRCEPAAVAFLKDRLNLEERVAAGQGALPLDR